MKKVGKKNLAPKEKAKNLYQNPEPAEIDPPELKSYLFTAFYTSFLYTFYLSRGFVAGY